VYYSTAVRTPQQLDRRTIVVRHCSDLWKIWVEIADAPILKGSRRMCLAKNAPQKNAAIAGRCAASVLASKQAASTTVHVIASLMEVIKPTSRINGRLPY